MENMRVLSVGTEIQRDAQGRPNAATTATLAVTPQEAEVLAIAMNTGSIQLVLRGYGDPSAITTTGANTADVLQQLRGGRGTSPSPAPAPSAPRASPRPSAPAPQIIIQRPPPPPPPPDSAVVNVYRGGKATPEKFDTTRKK
jgi:pilus assembly protein CpaB